jgi:hypothetical protein
MKSRSKTLTVKLVTLIVMAVALGASAGCSAVAPYERGKLAHPTMAAAESTSMGAEHLRAISEGATGGSAGSGSGCGCN